MEIKILKKENGEIVFILNGEEKKFEYDDFDYLIETVYNNDEEICYENDEELKEFKDLLEGIVNGSRTSDYRTAVAAAKEAKDKLESAENNS